MDSQIYREIAKIIEGELAYARRHNTSYMDVLESIADTLTWRASVIEQRREND